MDKSYSSRFFFIIISPQLLRPSSSSFDFPTYCSPGEKLMDADHNLSDRLLPDDDESAHLIITIPHDENTPQKSHQNLQISNGHHHHLTCNGSSKNVQMNLNQVNNPFDFLGAIDNGVFDQVPEPTTVDPFKNNTPRIEGIYEWIKIFVCLPIALIRLVLFGMCLSVGYFATKCALYGWKDKDNPMPRWRCRLMWVTRLSARWILFSFGYHWIKRKGRPAPREIAPIVVSNHVSYIEPIFFFYELSPTIVASDSHDSMPFVGTIIRAMQVIYVNRFSQLSRRNAVNEIKRKASSNQFPRVLLFPEGTTTNGRVTISFQLGAFIPGYPIQPVIVRYPHVHFDQSWGNISLAMLMFRMFTQFHNFMEVEYLPVVSPPEDMKENAVQLARRTSHSIATALNVVQTPHSYGDMLLYSKASEFKKEKPSLFMVEMSWVQSTFHLRAYEAVDLLEVFLLMNPDSSGHVEIHGFLNVLGLKPCYISEKIFEFVDVKKTGKITFKQFLLGSAYILKQPLFAHACELAFSECDVNGKSCILEQELRDSVALTIPNPTNEDVHGLFTRFDIDSDGRISKEDFISCLRRNPLLIALFSPQISRKSSLITGHRTAEDEV